MPEMILDIVLEHKSGETIIIDTKFNSLLITTRHRPLSFRSGHIFQIYSYLRSQENPNNENSLFSTGVLLHPTIDKEVDESVIIQGHKVRFFTVNLTKHPNEIKNRLLELIPQNLC